ncbi:hypothetical protein [Actinomycetospora chiangmaiensis]|uniref:hypothetical protein n=1 Tax=Actinomycetospora chiangmaiensis TaxID=402650 RepID=UPI00036A9F31|nr:hypothetical protein [Actinomycetospora chiangmaiensis]
MTDPAARRLVVAGALRLHVMRRIGPVGLPRDADHDALLGAARALAEGVDTVAGLQRVGFDPAYPGDGVPERVRHGSRLVLRSRVVDHLARDDDGTTLGVVMTVLIPGREPQVQISPEFGPEIGPGLSPG